VHQYLPDWRVGAVGWRYGYLHLLSTSWAPAFLDRVVTMTAIIIGYLIAVVAILPATENKNIVQKFKAWGYFRVLVGYFGSAIWSAFLLLALSVLPPTLPYAARQHWTLDGLFSAAWWFTFGFVVVAVLRATRLLLKLLTAR
jgi:hypothetical protein